MIIEKEKLKSSDIVDMIQFIYENYFDESDFHNVPIIKHISLFDDDVTDRAVNATELIHATNHDRFNINDEFFEYSDVTNTYTSYNESQLLKSVDIDNIISKYINLVNKLAD